MAVTAFRCPWIGLTVRRASTFHCARCRVAIVSERVDG
jgi:hypothetical protein